MRATAGRGRARARARAAAAPAVAAAAVRRPARMHGPHGGTRVKDTGWVLPLPCCSLLPLQRPGGTVAMAGGR